MFQSIYPWYTIDYRSYHEIIKHEFLLKKSYVIGQSYEDITTMYKMTINKLNLFSEGNVQTITTIVGNISAAVLAALSIIILSRKMGPALFGEFSAAFALVLILNKLNDLGLSLTAQKLLSTSLGNPQKANGYANEILTLRVILTIVITGIALPFSPFLAQILKISTPYLIPLSIVFGSAIVYYEYLLSVLQGFHKFFEAATANVIQALSKLILSTVYFFFSPSFLLTFVLYISLPVIPVLIRKKLLPSWAKFKISTDSKKYRKEIIKFTKHTAILILSATVIQNIGVLFVKGYLDSFDAGILGGVSRIALLFSIIGVSLAQVLYARVARYKNKSDIQNFIKKSYVLLLAAVIGFIVIAPFSSLLIQMVLGHQYIVGSNVLVWLLLSEFISIATVPFSALFFSFQKQSYFSISGILQLAVAFVGNILLVPLLGLTGAAWVPVIAKVLVFAFTLFFAYRTYTQHYNKDIT